MSLFERGKRTSGGRNIYDSGLASSTAELTRHVKRSKRAGQAGDIGARHDSAHTHNDDPDVIVHRRKRVRRRCAPFSGRN